jgi:photosystem II stability/assembly factor-like uncharacterized protein
VDGGSRLFRSVDGGETWEEMTRIAAQIGGASDESVWLSISPAFPSDPTLWASAIGGAYRSTDGGLTWEPFDPGVVPTRGTRLVPNPDYPADPTLEVLEYPSIEEAVLPEDLLYTPTLSVGSGERLLLGTRCGLFRSTDNGETWKESNAGLPATSVAPLAVASDGTIYALAGGDPRLFRLPGGGARWEALGPLPQEGPASLWGVALRVVIGSDGVSVLVLDTADGLFLSRDGGVTWDHIPDTELPLWYELPLLAHDFAESGLAHVLADGTVYRSDDGGGSWVAVAETADVFRLVDTPDGRLIGLAPDAVYEWEATRGPEWVQYPADFGRQTSVDLKMLSARSVTDRVIVMIVGGDVYLSEDGGRAWMAIGECDFDRPPYWISPRFDADRAIYAADDTGPYVSTDAGRAWIETGEGLPECEYGGPDCGFELLWAERSDGGYNLYALVRYDFHSHVWVARAQVD